MEKAKKIIIFLLINVLILGITVVIPMFPAHKVLNAYHFDVPSNDSVIMENGVPTSSFVANFAIIRRELQTQESLEALGDLMKIVSIERAGILFLGFIWVYGMLGLLVGIATIVIGIILRYKSTKTIYPKAFITAGILVVISYVYFLSILLSINVQTSLW